MPSNERPSVPSAVPLLMSVSASDARGGQAPPRPQVSARRWPRPSSSRPGTYGRGRAARALPATPGLARVWKLAHGVACRSAKRSRELPIVEQRRRKARDGARDCARGRRGRGSTRWPAPASRYCLLVPPGSRMPSGRLPRRARPLRSGRSTSGSGLLQVGDSLDVSTERGGSVGRGLQRDPGLAAMASASGLPAHSRSAGQVVDRQRRRPSPDCRATRSAGRRPGDASSRSRLAMLPYATSRIKAWTNAYWPFSGERGSRFCTNSSRRTSS